MVCGAPGREVDEDWIYCLEGPGGEPVGPFSSLEGVRGVAVLRGLRLLCPDCHEAKHQGLAEVRGRGPRALEHLARVNGVPLEEARALVDHAFTIHSRLSRVRRWRIHIPGLPGLSREDARRLEDMLNLMLEKGYWLRGPWLFHEYLGDTWSLEERAARETLELLALAAKRAGTTSPAAPEWIRALVEALRQRLEPHGVRVNEAGVRLLIQFILGDKARARSLEYLAGKLLHREWDPLEATSMIEWMGLQGKWIVFLPPRKAPVVLRRIVEALEGIGLSWQEKIPATDRDYRRKTIPVLVYTPSLPRPILQPRRGPGD